MDVQKYIGLNLRVDLLDGRSVDGTLTVVDSFGNLLLSNVYETSQDKIDPSSTHKRELGLVSVPKEQVERILLDKPLATAMKI